MGQVASCLGSSSGKALLQAAASGQHETVREVRHKSSCVCKLLSACIPYFVRSWLFHQLVVAMGCMLHAGQCACAFMCFLVIIAGSVSVGGG